MSFLQRFKDIEFLRLFFGITLYYAFYVEELKEESNAFPELFDCRRK